jgi:anti-anti-sigma factor
VIQASEINLKPLWKEQYAMERHLTTSTGSIDTPNEGATGLILLHPDTARGGTTAIDRGGRALAARSKLHPLSENARMRMHTLRLTGELNLRSAHTLEVEIERLLEDGVTSITLDLRQLTEVDPIGVAVIVFRCRLSKQQGYGIGLVPGSPSVQRAFEEAGVIDELPFRVDELAARRLRVAASGWPGGGNEAG